MASDGVMKMQMGGVGEVYIGRYTYAQATGLITPTFNKIGTGTLVLKKL